MGRDARRRPPLVLALAVALLLGATGDVRASHFEWLGHNADVPPPGSTGLGDFVPTFYRILDEAAPEWSGEASTETLSAPDGRVLARVAPAFKRQLDVEGSARLRDGRVINIEDRVRGRFRYLVLHHAPFGIGAPGYKLIPYRTVAVDPRRIRLGTVLYVPALAGITLPSGEIHDGYCFAHDTGRGITGNRIDLFVGFESDRDNALTRSEHVASYEPVYLYRVSGGVAKQVNDRFRKGFVWNE